MRETIRVENRPTITEFFLNSQQLVEFCDALASTS
mgnify:CR=1 FL=1